MIDHDALEPLPQHDLPRIPDGGLGKGLPSWLETPPSRRVKLAGEPAPIDLGALAADARLPQWLQELSDRVAQGENQEKAADDIGLQVSAANEPIEQPVAIEISAEPVPEPPAVVALPVEAPPAETPQSVGVTSEPRQIGVYLLYALAMIVIAALAAWLIWA